jgi:hypothetical protein
MKARANRDITAVVSVRRSYQQPVDSGPAPWQPIDFWVGIALLIVFGYSFTGKWFAFVALPVSFILLLNSNIVLTPLYAGLTRRGNPTSGISWAIVLSLMYGIYESVRGFLLGYETYPVFQILLFNLTPFYFFVGLWLGIRQPGLLRRWIRMAAWFGAAYPFLYYIVLNKAQVALGIPELFYSPGSGSETLIGLFAFEPNLARYWFPILVASCMTIAAQIRADWLGLGIALVIWGAAAKQLKRVVTIAGLLACLLLIGFLTDIHIPAIAGRGGEISARETIARAVSATNPELAEEFSSNTGFYRGTVTWRQNWWANIRAEVSRDVPTMLVGLGYGFPLRTLGQRDMQNSLLRSPHNIFYFALAYSGGVGVALFFWLQICVLRLLWQTYKATGQIFGVAVYSLTLVASFLGNFLETPAGGTMTYMIIGLAVSPIIGSSANFGNGSGEVFDDRLVPARRRQRMPVASPYKA